MVGPQTDDYAGLDVGGAGDLNSDGIDDVIIGSPGRQDRPGECYVIFGRPADDPFPVSFSLGDVDGTNGFKLIGTEIEDRLGLTVSGAGDLNGDGIDDVLMGANASSPDGQDDAGSCFVVYGRPAGSPFPASLLLAELDGTDGFRFDGTERRDVLGSSVAAAKDLNGDGRDDAIIGALGRNSTYVLYGRDASNPFPARLTTDDIDGTNGFAILGVDAGDASGLSVASAGDTNGDGLPDVIIGAPQADPIRQQSAGETSIVFGRPADSPFPAVLHLADLDGRNGVRLDGLDPDDRSGTGVGSVGDLNGDGVDDAIISAPNARPFFGSGIADGETYVVFGRSPRPCRPDLDCDGELTIIDFLAFNLFFDRGEAKADFDDNSTLDVFDFLAFVNDFLARPGMLAAVRSPEMPTERLVVAALTSGLSLPALAQTCDPLEIFSPPVPYEAGDLPISVAIGDLDGDADADLVVANRFGSTLGVLLNSGDATFAPQVRYGTGSSPVSVAISDLDGDGNHDLAVANEADGSVS
ncbi:Integrin alpha-5 (Fibronectin receptor subunit alpha) (Integrin alpha-F) (VLA-5) [Cleaved into: Integrin alpha-5 heavy chain, partial [Durusdinium trenchii]